MIRSKQIFKNNDLYKPFYKRMGLYIVISFIMVSLNFSALFHLINSENGILILKDINYKIKRNQYELDVIKQTNFNLEDRILNFSKEKDNDLMDQVIREYLGYQSNSEVTIVYKNNQSYSKAIETI